MAPEKNNTAKLVKVGLLIAILGGFLAFTVHKIYVADPSVYAEKIMVFRIEREAREGCIKNLTIATSNKEAIIEIRNNFEWIKNNQIELKNQNNSIQASQTAILKAVERLKE